MADSPNILFLMTDQMQNAVLDPGHDCRTPYLDRLAARVSGLRTPIRPTRSVLLRVHP